MVNICVCVFMDDVGGGGSRADTGTTLTVKSDMSQADTHDKTNACDRFVFGFWRKV